MTGQNLTESDARVLFVVWSERQKGEQAAELNNLRIQRALLDSSSDSNLVRGTSVANIKKILARLEHWTPPLLWRSRTGNLPVTYRLPQDTMITLPITARMVLVLDGDRTETVERNDFVKHILSLHMVDSQTKRLATRSYIEGRIDYCRDVAVPYLTESQGRIKASGRVNAERNFLAKIQYR